jgi:DnaJ homolog subfamily C member 19
MTIAGRPEGHAIPEFRLGWAAWTAHDGGVTVLLVVLLAVVVLSTLAAGKGAPRPAPTAAGAERKTSARSPSPYWFLAALVVGIVLMRFGVNALVVAGGMLLAGVRALVPLVRLLPLFQSLRQGAAPPGSRPPWGGSNNGSSEGHGRGQRMTRQEALQVFGLDENASREDVQREYRRLMRKVHPDLGGSSYLAAKINEAKDVLS